SRPLISWRRATASPARRRTLMRSRASAAPPPRSRPVASSRKFAPLPSIKKVVDKNTKAESLELVTLKSDEGNRPDITLEGLASLQPVREGGFITAGNASQLSDGASACVIMDAKLAEQRGLTVAPQQKIRGRGRHGTLG